MRIGPYTFKNNLFLAPMAGITDKPFRQLCVELGAGAAFSEMITSKPGLYDSRKTRLRMEHSAEAGIRIIQIAGAVPQQLADAAIFNVDHGAQIIDINMGCPAKKVCKLMAGSALLKDPNLVKTILESVVKAVSVPVTLKIRTGWDKEQNNAVEIARIAEDSGIQAMSIHGRSRACGFKGVAEHITTHRVKQRVSIPVIANGDINCAEEAVRVLKLTGADGVMIGRAAQGNPWIFRQIHDYLSTGQISGLPSEKEIKEILSAHLAALYEFYGEYQGVRIARKHLGWYCKNNSISASRRALFNQAETASVQLAMVNEVFDRLSYGELAA